MVFGAQSTKKDCEKQCWICLLFTLHARHQTTNYSTNTKSVLYTNLHKNKTYTNIGHKIFEELVPSVSSQLKKKKKHIRLGNAGIVDHSVDLSIPDFKKSIKKEWTETIKKKNLKYYINA